MVLFSPLGGMHLTASTRIASIRVAILKVRALAARAVFEICMATWILETYGRLSTH